ncbi:MAG: Fe-S cluster assembly protein SufD [Gammaproteobacteria bacterium]|nr:Fe-S cluster assembly protein SufD [Gammaproteobacteria bacterium]
MKREALSIDGVREVVRGLPDNGLAPIRDAAVRRLDAQGLPTPKVEDWKYTDLAGAIDISNRWLQSADAARPAATDDLVTEAISSIDATWLVIKNGEVSGHFLSEAIDAGVGAARLSAWPKSIASSRPLDDLNAALLHDGLHVTVTQPLEKPLGILIIDHAAGAALVSQSRVHLDIGKDCKAGVIEYHLSAGDDDHYANSVLSITVGANARLNHVRLQDRAIGHMQTTLTNITMGRDSSLQMASYDIGGGLIRNDLEINLDAPGASVAFDGLYLAGDGQHIDNHTRVDHRVGPATSTQEYRGILNGKCRCVWNGKAIVHKGADGTDASQANHNLLLTDKAEIDAKPELEIYADDVKCSHGTTVGQLDENALFYLRSRGLHKQHATQILTHAFAAGLVARIPVDAARDCVASIVESRLAKLVDEQSFAGVLQ